MSEAGLLDPRAEAPRAEASSAQGAPSAPNAAARLLSVRAARVAGRLARLLSSSPALVDGPLKEGVGFLAHMAETLDEPDGPREPSPLDRLAAGLGLTPVEVDLLVLAGLPEEHEGYGSILRNLHPRREPRATVGLAAQLSCESPHERTLLRELLESGPAARSGALTLSGDAPFFERSLLLADALWPALAGVDAWPSSLRPLVLPVALFGLDEWLATPAVQRATAALRNGGSRLVLVLAETESVALGRATALALASGVRALRFAWMPEKSREAREAAERLLAVHALARGAVPILSIPRPEGPGSFEAPDLVDFPGPVVVAARAGTVEAKGLRPVVPVLVESLSPTARRSLWRGALPELAEKAETLAAQYTVEPSLAAQVASDVRSLEALAAGPFGLAEVAESVRVRANLALSTGVKLVAPRARWDDLVLPPDRLAPLREAIDRLFHQARVLDEWGFLARKGGARGVRLLFSGPPGTGKTLSAEVLAAALGVDLLVVDVSRVVSKWIGETEKNLSEVFEAAERAQAVLLFDEADALFGRRTEVSDAHDRYANLETAYLLARLERFEGLAVLSTNLKQNLDPAFLRRLEFVVEFDEPQAREREALWRVHLPTGAPLAEDVDLSELAALYPVVGGLIRNAAVAAGFLAAAEGTAITREQVLRALAREYQKAGRAFPGLPAGFGPAH